MLIAFDVDLVLVDPSVKWRRFMDERGGFDYSQTEEVALFSKLSYDLSVYYNISRELAFSFWDSDDLYDSLKPIDGAVKTVAAILEAGHDVIFVSKCTDGHKESKHLFLRTFFGPDAVLIDTPDKGVLDGLVDVFIDDRNEFLNQFTSGETCLIRPNTEFTQGEELEAIAFCCSHITDVLDIIVK